MGPLLGEHRASGNKGKISSQKLRDAIPCAILRPSMKFRHILNALRATGRAVRHVCGRSRNPLLVTQDQYIARHMACFGCEHYLVKRMQCRLCGCNIALKAHLTTEICPATPRRWPLL